MKRQTQRGHSWLVHRTFFTLLAIFWIFGLNFLVLNEQQPSILRIYSGSGITGNFDRLVNTDMSEKDSHILLTVNIALIVCFVFAYTSWKRKKQYSKKKGQAAMEFMMTYGWAMLIVVISIGALGYFGVINPGRFAPGQCNMPPGFNCVGSTTKYVEIIPQDFGSAYNTVALQLINNNGRDVTNVAIVGKVNGVACTTYANEGGSPPPTLMSDGVVTNYFLNCDAAIPVNTKGRLTVDLEISYILAGQTLPHTKLGNIVAIPEPA